MIVGFHLYGLGNMTTEQLAELIRSHIIIEKPSYADNMANVLGRGYELNILCPTLNDGFVWREVVDGEWQETTYQSPLDAFGVPYKVIDIDETDTSSAVVFNAVDFRIEVFYGLSKKVVVMQPSEYVIIDSADVVNFTKYKDRGLVKIFTGSFTDRYFTDEYSLEFS